MNSDDQIQALKTALRQPIMLVGMMGAGKSRIGAALARALELPFYDSDKVIEEKAGMAVPDVFSEFGEEKFRRAEHNTIMELLDHKGVCVIATGGGALMHEDTLKAMKARSVSVWLQADLDTIMARVERNESRPLLQADDPRAVVKTLMEEREWLYAQANLACETDAGGLSSTIEDIIKTLCFRVIPGSV